MKAIRNLIWKISGKESNNSEKLINTLRSKGSVIGEDVFVYDTKSVTIDQTDPWLVTIGDHVRITSGVKILTHDYAWSVLKRKTGNILGAKSPVTIGSNVFIGMNTIITRGVNIGDNVIIGADGVVAEGCPSGGVCAGNPAKQIMSIEEFYEKRKSRQFEEAKVMARQYKARFGVTPPKEIFAEYFMLFADAQEAKQNSTFCAKMKLLGNYDETVAYLEQHSPMFAGYEAFLEACFRETDI